MPQRPAGPSASPSIATTARVRWTNLSHTHIQPLHSGDPTLVRTYTSPFSLLPVSPPSASAHVHVQQTRTARSSRSRSPSSSYINATHAAFHATMLARSLGGGNISRAVFAAETKRKKKIERKQRLSSPAHPIPSHPVQSVHSPNKNATRYAVFLLPLLLLLPLPLTPLTNPT